MKAGWGRLESRIIDDMGGYDKRPAFTWSLAIAPRSQSESDHHSHALALAGDTAPEALFLGQDRYRGPLPTCLVWLP